MRIEDIWWKRLSNPTNLIDAVVETLLDNRSAVVVFNETIPWRETFMDTIAQEIEMYSAEMRIKHHALSDTQDPGDFLLQKYCSRELQREYWPTDSKAKFLAEHPQCSLHKSYVFIDLSGDADRWISFIKEYTSYLKEDTHGLFVLFTNDRRFLDAQKKKGESELADAPIQFWDYAAYVHDYDTFLLCMTILSQKKLSMQQQQYLSEIAVALAGDSVVLAGELADRGEALAWDTSTVFQETMHTLGIFADNVPAQVRKALWQAQLKVLFPRLEQFRCQLIEAYRKDITDRFYDARTGTFNCETPDELELGQLQFLFKNTRILSMHDHELLFAAKEARNCLAHLNYLPYQEMKTLLEMNVHSKD